MPTTPRPLAAAFACATLALSGCAGAHLQSGEQALAQMYSAGQFKARADCYQRSGPTEASRCQRQSGPSYDDYQRARDKLQPLEPTAPPAD